MAPPKQPVGKQEIPQNGFAVTVEELVGWIDFSDVGTNGPVEAACQLIGKHYERSTAEGAPRSYRFPGPAESETLTVSIEGNIESHGS